MRYDVAIIGGGMAGLALSIDLSSRGYQVVVIEKGSYPRHKVCGEYISMESRNYLYRICPELNHMRLPVIDTFQLTSGNAAYTTHLAPGGFGISRYALEALLFKKACEQGVTFKLNTKATETIRDGDGYTVTTHKEPIHAKLVCNSSGRKSNLETQQNTPPREGTNYVGVKYHLKIAREQNVIEIHNFPGGYCGISNVEDNTSCLCYIVNSRYLKKTSHSIPALEKEFLFKNKNLEKIFTRAEFVFKEPLTISGINFRIKKPANDLSLFLGDSAGTISPITGNGMSMALRSAATLALQIDACFLNTITTPQLFKNYDRFWRHEFSTRVKLSRHFQKLAEHPSLTRLSIHAFHLIPGLGNLIIKQTHGNNF